MFVDTFIKNPSIDFDQGKYHFFTTRRGTSGIFFGEGEHMNFEIKREEQKNVWYFKEGAEEFYRSY